jgi:hypothetical protein
MMFLAILFLLAGSGLLILQVDALLAWKRKNKKNNEIEVIEITKWRQLK